MNDVDYKQRLLSDKLDLEELMTLAKESSAAVELDQSMVGRLSRVDALQKQAMATEVVRRRQVELNRIAAALERIEDDEFGFCLTCGKKIEPKRLSLNPSLPQCTHCASG